MKRKMDSDTESLSSLDSNDLSSCDGSVETWGYRPEVADTNERIFSFPLDDLGDVTLVPSKFVVEGELSLLLPTQMNPYKLSGTKQLHIAEEHWWFEYTTFDRLLCTAEVLKKEHEVKKQEENLLNMDRYFNGFSDHLTLVDRTVGAGYLGLYKICTADERLDNRRLSAGCFVSKVASTESLNLKALGHLQRDSSIEVQVEGTDAECCYVNGGGLSLYPTCRVRVYSEEDGNKKPWGNQNLGRKMMCNLGFSTVGEGLLATIPEMMAIMRCHGLDIEDMQTSPLTRLPEPIIRPSPKGGTVAIKYMVAILGCSEAKKPLYDFTSSISVTFAVQSFWPVVPILWVYHG